MPTALVLFHTGDGTDAAGRRLDDILAWNDARLEAVHDYIQWLFPLPEASAFNARAPILDATDIAAYAAPAPQAGLLRALNRMLAFYGYTREAYGDTVTVIPSATHAARLAQWVTPGNHNFLRISRILRSLSLLHRQHDAHALLAALEILAAGTRISPITLRYWRHAV